jgi:hypothetical protein
MVVRSERAASRLCYICGSNVEKTFEALEFQSEPTVFPKLVRVDVAESAAAAEGRDHISLPRRTPFRTESLLLFILPRNGSK